MDPATRATLRQTIDIRAERELVWHAWTRADRITAWFAPEAVIEPVAGGAFELYFIPGNRESMNTRGCSVTRIEEPSLLAFTWRAPDQFEALMNGPERTAVTVRLDAHRDGTNVSVEHVGFGLGAAWDEARAWHEAAWTQALESLRGALESGEGALCCAP